MNAFIKSIVCLVSDVKFFGAEKKEEGNLLAGRRGKPRLKAGAGEKRMKKTQKTFDKAGRQWYINGRLGSANPKEGVANESDGSAGREGVHHPRDRHR